MRNVENIPRITPRNVIIPGRNQNADDIVQQLRQNAGVDLVENAVE
ncbi:hypothetical protein A2U01_0063352, partial [Trifolium medium]|nr:hypothetical protein [Trifolium medium]